MTLDILICTINKGIKNVPNILIPKAEGISYVISMQYTDEKYIAMIPEILKEREDVTVSTLEGRGLSRNRNNAIAHSTADIVLIADDDNRYTLQGLRTIIATYENEAAADVILFRSNLRKYFPDTVMNYHEAFLRGYYPSSVEITFRRNIGISFDERFGIGSRYFCCGEESIFLKDCEDKGLTIILSPSTIVETKAVTSCSDFINRKDVQTAKGAMFLYLFGYREAVWRSIKEAGFHFVHSHANPFIIFRNMYKGISELSAMAD